MYKNDETSNRAAKNSRLFLSPLVLLELKGGERLTPGFTSCPNGGYGVSLTGSTLTLSLGQDSAAISRYMRVENVTALLIQARHKERLTLMYPVPKGTKTAVLRFDNAPPIPVTIVAKARYSALPDDSSRTVHEALARIGQLDDVRTVGQGMVGR